MSDYDDRRWNAQYTIGNTELHMHNDIAKILIPAEKIGYVELNGTEQRRIGFGGL